MPDKWIDLCDPSEQDLRAVLPPGIHDLTMLRILQPATTEEPRPRLEVRDQYVFGVLVIPAIDDDDGFVAHEIDLVATPEKLITVRKSPPGHNACEFDAARDTAVRQDASPGECLWSLFDEIAERFLDLIDGFNEQIDLLEDEVTVDLRSPVTRQRISDIRHDILHVRRVLAPTRDAARAILDDRVELQPETLFPREIELHFADAYDKLLRATDGLDLSRDLLAGVRDYLQAEIANDQNEVMKKLTVIAAVLLAPTFIVGLYGQNFFHMPELHWQYGYLYSWGLILIITALQLIYFRRKRWI
ncbi:MAG TPA: magnesium transporter CorA family protein [Acidimicrobiia bacterium]|nr:magnesium transporter CorA family protein [Acidimicrobiia bacterium]